MSDFSSKIIQGYQKFSKKYASGSSTLLDDLAKNGQTPAAMIVACSDSRVDPAILTQADPGDYFILRTVANIIPKYSAAGRLASTGAALEYGVCYLNVPELVIMGHSDCGGISALQNPDHLHQDQCISHWISASPLNPAPSAMTVDALARESLLSSYQNLLSYPWLQERVDNNTLRVHLWFYDLADVSLKSYCFERRVFMPLA